MNYNFCTLFDSNYIHKGIALHQSLINVNCDFNLFILALDDDCFYKLTNLNLQNVFVIKLENFETKELLSVKKSRTIAEYCWTCGPSLIYYCINKFSLDSCTYLDSDMMFYKSPKTIFDEIGDNSIAITEHFTEKIDELTGRFCVQFVYFKNDTEGLSALKWWRDKCIEWCFSRFEDGKYGDQKYLDYFPSLFEKICILKNRGAGVAQWNAFQYDFSKFGKIIFNTEEIDIIFYHYHGTRIELNHSVLILKTITYDLNYDLNINCYLPYLELLKKVYITFLNKNVATISIESRNISSIIFSKIKKILRHNKIIQYVYYNIFNFKYKGYDTQ